MKKMFTSEAVSAGHPDKVCDLIADRIVEESIKNDPFAHVACEVFTSENFVLIGGEITSNGPKIDYEKIVRETLKEIGYTSSELGIDSDKCEILIKVREQSQEINNAVTKNELIDYGAGDQGIIFGFACNQTSTYMPLPIALSNEIMKLATKLFKEGKFIDARPDMKCQVTFDYDNNRIDNILISVQHNPTMKYEAFRQYIKNEILIPVVHKYHLNDDFELRVNPSGSFVVGGPAGDTGVTGRKLACDTYGGYSRLGGGALSGKDPTKVDRSACYYARYIAKNLVVAGVADSIEIEIAYAIGVAHPISVSIIDSLNLKFDVDKVVDVVNKVFDMRPGAIIKQFNLHKPEFKYSDVAVFGHFGRDDLNLPWEKLDKVDLIISLLN